MRRFAVDVTVIVAATFIVNWLNVTWDFLGTSPPRMRIDVPTPTRVPTSTPIPTTAPLPATKGAKFHFVYLPLKVWYRKEDALAYREAVLDGNPIREFVTPDKVRNITNSVLELKREDGLIMVKVEGTDLVGWIQ